MLDNRILQSWQSGFTNETTFWPTNATSHWLVSQFAARTADGQWLALGIAQPGAHFSPAKGFSAPPGVLVTSWNSLGAALLGHVAHRILWVATLIAVMLIGCLWLAFRNWQEVVLGIAALALSFALLLAMMAVIGWSWNLLSLVALPLLLGSSVDSTIHVQLALRRHGDDRKSFWRITSKALLLCAGANVAGFGSLAWSNNAGLASLDLVCAVGVTCVFLVCVGLLPAWWRLVVGHRNL